VSGSSEPPRQPVPCPAVPTEPTALAPAAAARVPGHSWTSLSARTGTATARASRASPSR
jgi:hypothetical protein